MDKLRLDLHTHLKIAKRTAFRHGDVARAVTTLNRRGLTGLAVTEHAHGHGFWEIYEHLESLFPYRYGRFELGGCVFYSGVEVTLDEQVDILFIAPLDELRRLDEAFDHPLTAGYHPSAIELVDRLADLDLDAIRIAAHPNRPDKPASGIAEPLLQSIVNAVEINGRFTDPTSVKGVRELADRLSTPIVGGSDAHVWAQLGAVSTRVGAASDRYQDVRDAVLNGQCEPIVHDEVDRLVVVAERLKGRLKRRLPKLPRVPDLRPL